MQIVIDISKDRYDEIMSMDWKNGRRFIDEELRAIHDGKALEQEPCDKYIKEIDHLRKYIYKLETQIVEQESCEDCISRQAAIVALDDRMSSLENVDMQIAMGFAKGIIHELPSVTPQQKVGRWIEHFDESGKWYECDQCHTDWGGTVNYCPNCGAKM